MNTPIGYQALVRRYHLRVLPHYRESYVASEGRGSVRQDINSEIHVYPKGYEIKQPNNPFEQMEFAIKYEGIHLEILAAVFQELEVIELEHAIQAHPTSKYARIVWFLYEFLTEKTLNIPDAKKTPYIDLLDSKRYFTLNKKIRSPRHRVNNNLLGNRNFCPMIRRTLRLNQAIEQKYDEQARKITAKYDPHLITRASHYFYTKETLSSYEIERERPSQERVFKFVNLLRKIGTIGLLTKARLIEIQNMIVDPRFSDVDYRVTQNYVGDNLNAYIQHIHYISPKPENVQVLMDGWLACLEQCMNDGLHPVLIATAISFGFIFIRPFEDGNGRIHRFLIHYVLSKMGFSPDGIIFPISAIMLNNMREYDGILESFSIPLMRVITDYHLSNEGVLTVKQPTHIHYKYIDYTQMAEYLFSCIDTTLHEYFEKEILFLLHYDQTKRDIQSFIDMPDKLIDLFIQFIIQNNGVLNTQKQKKYLHMLKDDEIAHLIGIVKKHMLKPE